MRDECAVLVAQHFLPLNVVSAQRALRIARALLGRYDRVYVVSADARHLDRRVLDEDYGRDVLADSRLVRLYADPFLTHYGYGAKPSWPHRAIGAATTRLFCGPGFDWAPALGRALDAVPQAERVGVALATGPPFITFKTVIRWAKQRSAPTILDYRDLWSRNPHARYFRLARTMVNRFIERPVNRAATIVTTVSEGCQAILVADNERLPVRVLYNSPDRAYLAYFTRVTGAGASVFHPAEIGRLRIVFAGEVYRGCTFAALLPAIAALAPEDARKVTLHYYGASSALARREFQEFGLLDRLVDHGKVSKEESLRAICGADLLLSLIHTERLANTPAVTGLMTTKLFDYLLSGIPILNIGPENADANKFVARIGYRAFHSFTADDTQAMTAFLQQAIAGAGLMRVAPLSVAMPDFEDGLNAILTEATSMLPHHSSGEPRGQGTS